MTVAIHKTRDKQLIGGIDHQIGPHLQVWPHLGNAVPLHPHIPNLGGQVNPPIGLGGKRQNRGIAKQGRGHRRKISPTKKPEGN